MKVEKLHSVLRCVTSSIIVFYANIYCRRIRRNTLQTRYLRLRRFNWKKETKANVRRNLCVSLLNIKLLGKGKIIFNGIVQNIRTSNINGNYYLEIQALTSSFELDVKEKSRSFRDVNMTYDELIGIILKDYPGYRYEQCIGEGKKIGKPLFQYKETDWSFF
ncbi:hypothetical protein [Clostridium estertheticum]|uniref:hypothetical protein n=1 Tax=Clostridium estertheticum TaxID=238834 RepID=UPI001C0BD0EA|nr:hypothetical protein [Clostridium estertheticum]MBU3075530.1 hypothetical protein [Clostridium estertheticum]MBU3165640.1 hypothetical protein [Clostridium estertheticum]